MISVIIPVYKEPNNLENIVKNLRNCEIIIVADEPNEKLREILDKIDAIKVIREKRMGKWSALNLGIEKASGDIIVFLDSDVKIDEDFIERIEEEFKDCDVLDFIKIPERRCFLEKMIYYDYLGYNFANYILKDKTIALNGAGFAINRRDLRFRREILEDMDFGTQCYEKSLKYKLSRIKIIVGCPRSFKEWLKQRRRWYYGAWLWIRKNYKTILRFIKEKPISIVSGMLTFPITFSIPFLFLGISSIFIGFVVSTLIYGILSYKLALQFNPLEFFIYYFLYQPISFIYFLLSFRKREVDWVC